MDRLTQYQRVFALTFAVAFIWAFAAFFVALATAQPSWAQTTVDLRPAANSILEWVAGALGVALTTLASFGIRFLSARIGLANSQLEAGLSARLNEIIFRGIDYAHATVAAEINDPKSSIGSMKVDNYFMGLAVNYVLQSAPEILKRFNFDKQRIQQAIMARIPGYLGSQPFLPSDPTVSQTAAVPAASILENPVPPAPGQS